MEKHPQITVDRIGKFLGELRHRLWLDHLPLTVAVYQCPEPITYADAVQQSYTPVAVGYQWGPAWSTAWFHVQGEYPAEWAGSTVAALIDTGSEALVWQDGAPAQGLDVNRQDFVLEYDAAGAGQVDLYIEAAGNELFGARQMKGRDPEHMFTLHTASLARLNTPVWDLSHDIRVLLDLATRLPEDSSRRARLIYALNEVVNLVRQNGDDAIPQAREILAKEFDKPADASVSDVMGIGHSHIDVAWLWPLRETKRKASRTFSTVLKYMERYPEYHFTQSQPQLYAYVKENYPALFARIKDAVATGRWEPEGAMWVEADCNIISGESMIRQILYGTRFFREEFGVENSILWLPDVFGYSA
ncbi:MAG TPA: alpha-mannosidase, partial [Armatimonadota bacterium]|nr:alpha-mannosidase [Armatimonadota bacterium]